MKPTPPPPEDQAPTQQMDRDKVDRLVAVDAARYKDVDIDHLMMYAIGQLEHPQEVGIRASEVHLG